VESQQAIIDGDPGLRELRIKQRQRRAASQTDQVRDWRQWVIQVKSDPYSRELYKLLWEGERSLVGDASPEYTEPSCVDRVMGRLLETYPSLQNLWEQTLEEYREEITRAALAHRLQAGLELMAQKELPDWQPPEAPKACPNRWFFIDSPWQDGQVNIRSGGSEWESNYHAWLPKLENNAVIRKLWKEVQWPIGSAADKALRRALSKKVPLQAGTIFLSDIENRFHSFFQGYSASEARKALAILSRAEWKIASNAQWSTLEGFTSEAKVGERGEGRLLEKLQSLGARWVKRPLELPVYQSWASIEPCSTLTLKVKDAQGKRGIIEYTPHNSEGAPFSERGIFSAWARDKTILQSIFALFEGRFLELEGTWEIPSKARLVTLGRLDDLPTIIHGLTGVENVQTAAGRLQAILDSGGLRSTADRRRRRLKYVSLSPLGDIGSGVDWGVACKLGSEPCYGKWVFFELKPETLLRRDMWFADRDFGGGSSRYDNYNLYARSIGQEYFWLPPSLESRREHISKGISKPDNEVWFAGEVGLEEIQTIWLFDDSVLLAMRGKIEASIPDVTIKLFNEEDKLMSPKPGPFA
jgi:hypothetical protein